jgi:hypothetical protein
MIWLRLEKGQLALVLLSAGCLLAAITVLLLPAPALPEAATAAPQPGAPPGIDIPFPAVANDPNPPLVEGNPFDASRQPPAQRRTTMGTGTPEGEQLTPYNFTLLGTVITGNGRDIAVIQGNPAVPRGGTYHVGEEPVPGFRVTRITRDGATITGQGQNIELKVRKASDTGAGAGLQGGRQGVQRYDADLDEEDDE